MSTCLWREGEWDHGTNDSKNPNRGKVRLACWASQSRGKRSATVAESVPFKPVSLKTTFPAADYTAAQAPQPHMDLRRDHLGWPQTGRDSPPNGPASSSPVSDARVGTQRSKKPKSRRASTRASLIRTRGKQSPAMASRTCPLRRSRSRELRQRASGFLRADDLDLQSSARSQGSPVSGFEAATIGQLICQHRSAQPTPPLRHPHRLPFAKQISVQPLCISIVMKLFIQASSMSTVGDPPGHRDQRHRLRETHTQAITTVRTVAPA